MGYWDYIEPDATSEHFNLSSHRKGNRLPRLTRETLGGM